MEEEDSTNSVEKVFEEIEKNINKIWIENKHPKTPLNCEELFNDISDIYVEKSNSKGSVIEIKDLNTEKYENITELIMELNKDDQFPGKVFTYQEYVKKQKSELGE